MIHRYDLEFKNEFWFERSQRAELLAKLPLRFVWGVADEDNGNYLDPSSKGSLVLDPSFNMAAPESQEWLSRFCKEIRNQPFFQPTLGPLLPNCFIETFQSWMDRRCEVIVDHPWGSYFISIVSLINKKIKHQTNGTRISPTPWPLTAR